MSRPQPKRNMGTKQLQQIAERCQQGDRDAFALLYTAMRQPLRAVCLGYVHDEAVADDLLHDAFLLIFFQIGKLKDTTRAESWMTMLTRRVSLLYLRQQRRQRQAPLSVCAATVQRSEALPTVENLAESSLAVQEILAAVDALPEGYRHVFRLFMLEGMTHKEIAALLHIDPHSSASQLYHAKALLRKRLRQIGLALLAMVLPLCIYLCHINSGQRYKALQNPVTKHSGPLGDEKRHFHSEAEKERLRTLQKPQDSVVLTTMLQRRERLRVCEHSSGMALPTTQDTVRQRSEALPTTNKERLELPKTLPTTEKDRLQRLEALPTTRKVGGDWLLAVTYSGKGNGRDMRLPYADAETNPMVYDSVAHHQRPLTVGLMLNRRLSDYWQLGVGLNYQRMTSDMLSGNTYVTLSQHQLVQYIGLSVSVSWHYPLGRRFSTYLSLSASASLPLRSTLESVYIMDGQSYEPTTERLHPAVQWSAGLGLGLQYNLTPHIGFFAEPGLHYHFKSSDYNVRTWNTEHPLDFNVPFGLRISF